MADTSSVVVGGRYRVLGTLGKGAMGLVYMAYDPVLDRKVAIKQMTAEIADNEELRQRFYVEARAAARLNHPNIITIHELQESGGDIFMIMELLEGKSLAALIQAKPVPLSIQATLDVMAQVCDGLEYAHQRAIVHRDIKPGNLFLTPSGVVKILDFGIARLGSLHMTAAGALIGTPDYMSPEQIRGDEIDRRTDLWAVGAVLYQLLSGGKPFDAKPLARLLASIAQTPHVPLQQRVPSLPKGVSDLVERLLSKPRDGRPASAGLVRDELRAILGRESSVSTKATLAEDEYEETVFMAVPPRPLPSSAPPPATAAPPAAAPPPPPLPAEKAAAAAQVVPPPLVPLTTMTGPTAAAPASAATTPAVTPASPTSETEKKAAIPPVLPAIPPVPAQVPAAAASIPVPAAAATRTAAAPIAVPTPAKKSSALMIVGIVAAIAATLGLAMLAGAGWWYLKQRANLASSAAAAVQASGQPSPAEAAAAPPSEPQAAAAPGAPGDAVAPPASSGAPLAPPGTAPHEGAAPAATPASTPAPDVRATQQPAPASATAPASQAAAVPPSQAATQPSARPQGGGLESGVSAAPGSVPRTGLAPGTVDAFKGPAGQPTDAGGGASTLASINRINYVLGQYVQALVNADTAGIREYRPSLSTEETGLMRARQLKVRLEDLRVEVSGLEAMARCRRKLDGVAANGAVIQEDRPVAFRLIRRPTGWVIADVR